MFACLILLGALLPAHAQAPQSVGVGDIASPARGPAPTVPAAGSGFMLVKNWDFGSSGTIRNVEDLSREFQFRDHWGTLNNGNNYGSKSVAPNSATAIRGQPHEDASRPFRSFTAEALRTYVRPLDPTARTVSASRHEVGNGFFMPKFTLPGGGAHLGRDLLWETRVRINNPAPGFWFAIWTAGNEWDKGAEMDVVESFGFDNGGGYTNFDARLFHVNSVGGSDDNKASAWEQHVPGRRTDLTQWHTFTWLYRKDDTYVVWFDGIQVQSGRIHWTRGGKRDGKPINMVFLFDPSWGHTKVKSVDVKDLPAAQFRDFYYEWDYSRVYLRP